MKFRLRLDIMNSMEATMHRAAVALSMNTKSSKSRARAETKAAGRWGKTLIRGNKLTNLIYSSTSYGEER